MNTESCTPKIKVNIKLEKFDGEYQPGMTPVEIITREYEFSSQQDVEKFLGDVNGHDQRVS